MLSFTSIIEQILEYGIQFVVKMSKTGWVIIFL